MKRILCLLIAATCAVAQPQQSENFRMLKSVLDAGGGASTLANFRLVSAFGQSTPVGLASSPSFHLSAGFLSPMFSVSPLSPIQDLVIMRQPASQSMQLDWSAISGAELYRIYRDENPLFTPAPGNQIGSVTGTTFVDTDVVMLPPIKFFYIVTAVNEDDNPVSSQSLTRKPGNVRLKN